MTTMKRAANRKAAKGKGTLRSRGPFLTLSDLRCLRIHRPARPSEFDGVENSGARLLRHPAGAPDVVA